MLNAIVMIGTRILFAMGRDGLLWRRAATVDAGGTPTIATLVTTTVALLGIVTGTFQRLVAIAAFFLALNYSICCLSLFVLRRREPDRVRVRSARGAIRGPRRSCSSVRSRCWLDRWPATVPPPSAQSRCSPRGSPVVRCSPG